MSLCCTTPDPTSTLAPKCSASTRFDTLSSSFVGVNDEEHVISYTQRKKHVENDEMYMALNTLYIHCSTKIHEQKVPAGRAEEQAVSKSKQQTYH